MVFCNVDLFLFLVFRTIQNGQQRPYGLSLIELMTVMTRILPELPIYWWGPVILWCNPDNDTTI